LANLSFVLFQGIILSSTYSTWHASMSVLLLSKEPMRVVFELSTMFQMSATTALTSMGKFW
jgi:hypothetical protein